MLRRNQNNQEYGNQPLPNSDRQDDDLLATFEPLRKKQSTLKKIVGAIAIIFVMVVLWVLLRSGRESSKPAETGTEAPEPQEPMIGKQPQDPKGVLKPIDAADRCNCKKCKEWRELHRKPWKLANRRKNNYVCGCSSHLMEWHQVTSAEDGKTLEGPGHRFKNPGVICDICQKDFAVVGKKLWNDPTKSKEDRVLHSWTCYKCVWEDPDRFHTDAHGQRKHVINHGIDVCGECAKKCPDQIRTFKELGPEGKLLHPGHPGDHLHHESKTSLVKQMRERVKDEL